MALSTPTKVAVASGGAATAAAGTGASIYLTTGSSNSGTRISKEEEHNNELIEEETEDNKETKPNKVLEVKQPQPINKIPELRQTQPKVTQPPVKSITSDLPVATVVEQPPVSKNYTYAWTNNSEFTSEQDSLKNNPTIGYHFSLFLLDPDKEDSYWTSNNKDFIMNIIDTDGDNYKYMSDKFKEGVKGNDQDKTLKNLKNRCKEIYKTAVTDDLIEELTSKEPKPSLLKDTFRYCSLLIDSFNLVPHIKKSAADDINKPKYIGNIFNHYFLDYSSDKNKIFWEIKQYWYDHLDENEKPEKEDFETYTNQNHGFLQAKKFSIKKFCKSALEEEIKETPSINLLTVFKYCSFWETNYETIINKFEEDNKPE